MELATMMYGGNSGSAIPQELEQESDGGIHPMKPGAGPWSDRSLSAIGGVETGDDAAQFLLMGASTVQVCTGVMIHGYKLAGTLCEGLAAFMDRHGFATIDDFRGHALNYFTTHAELVRRQAEIKAAEKAAREGMVTKDTGWDGEKFVEQSDKLVANDD